MSNCDYDQGHIDDAVDQENVLLADGDWTDIAFTDGRPDDEDAADDEESEE